MSDSPEDANRREATFFETVAQTGWLYGLNNGVGWFNWSEDGEHEFPVWSDEAGAQACASLHDPSYKPVAIERAEFVSDFLPQFVESGIWVAINPLPEMTGNSFPPEIIEPRLAPPA